MVGSEGRPREVCLSGWKTRARILSSERQRDIFSELEDVLCGLGARYYDGRVRRPEEQPG